MRFLFRLFVASLIATTALMAPSSPAYAAVDVGQPAPDLVVDRLDGQAFDLANQRGEVTIINFWATWCEPCRKETPALQAVYRRYHADGLEMIGLSADRAHERAEVAKAAASFGYPVAMLEDTEDNGFGSPAELPQTYVVDRNEIIRAVFLPDKGALTEQALTDAVLPLLAEKASNPAHKQLTPRPHHKSFWQRLFRSSNSD